MLLIQKYTYTLASGCIYDEGLLLWSQADSCFHWHCLWWTEYKNVADGGGNERQQLGKVNHWLALLLLCCFGTYLHPPWQGLPPVKASGITADQATGLLSDTTGEYYLDYTERSGKILCHPRFTTDIPMLLFQHLHPICSSAQKKDKAKNICN